MRTHSELGPVYTVNVKEILSDLGTSSLDKILKLFKFYSLGDSNVLESLDFGVQRSLQC